MPSGVPRNHYKQEADQNRFGSAFLMLSFSRLRSGAIVVNERAWGMDTDDVTECSLVRVIVDERNFEIRFTAFESDDLFDCQQALVVDHAVQLITEPRIQIICQFLSIAEIIVLSCPINDTGWLNDVI
jgi:hypothetical protein